MTAAQFAILTTVLAAAGTAIAAAIRWGINQLIESAKATRAATDASAKEITASLAKNTQVTADSVTAMALLGQKIDRLDVWITTRTKQTTSAPDVSAQVDKIAESIDWIADRLTPVEHVDEGPSPRMMAITQVRATAERARAATPAQGVRAPRAGTHHDKKER